MKKNWIIVISLVTAGVIVFGLILYVSSTTDTNSNNKGESIPYVLEILDLKENYSINDEISFIVHENGFDVRCISFYVKIYDVSKNGVWEDSSVSECPPGLGKSSFDNRVPFSGIKLDNLGKYWLTVESRGQKITHSFSVINNTSS